MKVTVRRPARRARRPAQAAGDLQGKYCGTVGSESAPRLRLRLGARPGEPAAPS